MQVLLLVSIHCETAFFRSSHKIKNTLLADPLIILKTYEFCGSKGISGLV